MKAIICLVLALLIESVAFADDLDAIIEAAATRHQVSPALVRAVIDVESGGNRNAVSRRGAKGLMQLMPRTAKELGVTRPFDIKENIRGGVRYLAEQMRRFKDLGLALAAYNAGPGAVVRAGGIPSIRETKRYVREVLRRYARLRRQETLGEFVDLNRNRGLAINLAGSGGMLAMAPKGES